MIPAQSDLLELATRLRNVEARCEMLEFRQHDFEGRLAAAKDRPQHAIYTERIRELAAARRSITEEEVDREIQFEGRGRGGETGDSENTAALKVKL